MKTLILAMLISTTALAQTALDPTQSGAYPKFNYALAQSGPVDPNDRGGYLDHSCGYWVPVQYDEVTNEDGTVTGAFKFLTSCSTGGRGTQPRRFESCWAVTFATDRYTVTDRTLLLYATWKQGQPAITCPAL